MAHARSTIANIHNIMSRMGAFAFSALSGNVHDNWASVETGRMKPYGDGLPAMSYEDKHTRPVYVIKSWHTPIAWCFTDAPTVWYMPGADYSQSTRRHKTITRDGVQLMGGTVSVPAVA